MLGNLSNKDLCDLHCKRVPGLLFDDNIQIFF